MNNLLFDLAVKFIAGGAVVVLITLIAKRMSLEAAALISFIPAVSLVAFYFIGHELGHESLVQMVKLSIYSVALLFLFIIYLTFLLNSYNFAISLGIAMILWTASAFIAYNILID